MVITEALAELKLLSAKIAKQRSTMKEYLIRHNRMVDPFAKEGGSEKYIASTLQSINDLEENIITLRQRIAAANIKTTVAVNGVQRTIADWLVWRKEIAPNLQAHYTDMLGVIQRVRAEAAKRGSTLVPNVQEAKADDVVVNVDEPQLLKEMGEIGDVLARLDGQLSLKNATVEI